MRNAKLSQTKTTREDVSRQNIFLSHHQTQEETDRDTVNFLPQTNKPIRANLKWFNNIKGYGFVVHPTTGRDAFLHITTLNKSGFKDIPPNTDILCTFEESDKGLAVTSVKEVIIRRETRDHDIFSMVEPLEQSSQIVCSGYVKWFLENLGFGFLKPDDEDFEVFVHLGTLSANRVNDIQLGERVKFTARQSHKGWEAIKIMRQES